MSKRRSEAHEGKKRSVFVNIFTKKNKCDHTHPHAIGGGKKIENFGWLRCREGNKPHNFHAPKKGNSVKKINEPSGASEGLVGNSQTRRRKKIGRQPQKMLGQKSKAQL